jgi:hypothetical protein
MRRPISTQEVNHWFQAIRRDGYSHDVRKWLRLVFFLGIADHFAALLNASAAWWLGGSEAWLKGFEA